MVWIIAQSAALFASTHVHHTYKLHTCFSCKWYFLSFLMCAFSSTVCLLLKVLRLTELWANFCWGGRRVSQGWQKHFSFGQATYSADVMHLCRGCETADYLHKALKNFDFDGSPVCCMQSICTWVCPLGKYWNFGSLRVHLLAIHISAQINGVCSQVGITAQELWHQTFTKSKSSWPTRCGVSCMDIPHPHPLGG